MTNDNVSDELRELWPDLVERKIFPSTHRAIPEDQRAAFPGEYERAISQFHRVSLIPDRANDNVGAAMIPHANGLSRSADGVILHPQPSPRSGGATSLNPQPRTGGCSALTPDLRIAHAGVHLRNSSRQTLPRVMASFNALSRMNRSDD